MPHKDKDGLKISDFNEIYCLSSNMALTVDFISNWPKWNLCKDMKSAYLKMERHLCPLCEISIYSFHLCTWLMVSYVLVNGNAKFQFRSDNPLIELDKMQSCHISQFFLQNGWWATTGCNRPCQWLYRRKDKIQFKTILWRFWSVI